jgi:hypothetical protein
MAADGQHTVGQFVEQMAMQYEGGPPSGLREQIFQVVSELGGEGIIRFHEREEEMPVYFREDYFSQPPEIWREKMRTDGLINLE